MEVSRPASEDLAPGVRRPYPARDGALVRLRVPGGRIDRATLSALSSLSGTYGDGLLQLTVRGNLQLRSLPTQADGALEPTVVRDLESTGLLDHPDHERVRSIVVSSLPAPDRPPMRPLAEELDAAIVADPDLAGLPGNFLWAIDDGSGDVASTRWDLCYQAVSAASGLVAVAGHQVWEVTRRTAVSSLITAAQEFVRVRSRLPRPPLHPHTLGVRDLARYAARLEIKLGSSGVRSLAVTGAPPIGPVGDDLLAGVPLGMLTPEMVEVLPDDPVTITPWRQLLVPRGAYDMAGYRAAGFAIDPTEPWSRVSACIGSAGCVHGAVDTLAMAERLVDAARAGEVVLLDPVHLSGCEHRCGAPHTSYVDLVAPKRLFEAIDTIQEGLYQP